MIKYILNGDSKYVLSKLPNQFIDLIITSPPYNVGHNYDVYDDNKEINEYFKLITDVFEKCYNILKEDGKLCINVPFAIKNMKTKKVIFLATKIAGIVNEIGFKDFEIITWHKGESINHFQGNNTAWGSWKSPSCPNCRPMCESIMVFYKKEKSHMGDKNNIDITADEFKIYTKNSWYIESNGYMYNDVICESNFANKKEHPAPYPLELIERLIKMYSYKNDIILDPFNGTGTTTLAAANLNRQYIGIELSDLYCDIALKRMEDYSPLYLSYDDRFSKLVNSDENTNTLNFYFPYKESFNPNILSFLNNNEVNSIYDPFMGTGSSFMSECSSNSMCIGQDTNPLSIEITKAKLIPLEIDEINKIKEKIAEFSITNIKNFDFPNWKPYATYVKKDRYDLIQSLIEYFRSSNENIYRFVKYVIISNLQVYFDYKRDGNGIKYRESKISYDELLINIKRDLLNAVEAKFKFDITNKRNLFIKNVSSIDEAIELNFDCAITSPPYCNMFDYFEVYKIELWTSKLVDSYEEWKKMKKTAMRSNLNSSINKDKIYSDILNDQIALLKTKNEANHTVDMINNYFFDINKLLLNVFNKISLNGHFYIVVGNSFYSGVPIPTDEIICELAKKIGYNVKKMIIARKLSTSSQQLRIINNKDKIYLRETIITLER